MEGNTGLFATSAPFFGEAFGQIKYNVRGRALPNTYVADQSHRSSYLERAESG